MIVKLTRYGLHQSRTHWKIWDGKEGCKVILSIPKVHGLTTYEKLQNLVDRLNRCEPSPQ